MKKIIYSGYVFLSTASLHCFAEKQNDGPTERPDRVTGIERSTHYDLKIDYSEFENVVRKKYEIMLATGQLKRINEELRIDLNQILNVRTNPKNLKDKKWGSDELNNIIDSYLKEENQ
jgi:hypothetical protein